MLDAFEGALQTIVSAPGAAEVVDEIVTPLGTDHTVVDPPVLKVLTELIEVQLEFGTK